MLRRKSKEKCGLDYLRTYWYDGARHGFKTMTQHSIAALPNVKLRLGRINARGQQKGVDALIYRDLMTLAHERAISDAFLLSGDEDLREGVIAAQDRGVRVTLFGVSPGSGNRNQSQELVYEADEVIVLKRADLTGYFVKTPQSTSPAVGNVDWPSVGRDFATRWLQGATVDEIRIVVQEHPRIPHEIDVKLIGSLAGSPQDKQEARHQIRNSFWATVREHTG